MTEPTAQVSKTIDASPAEIWDALTTPEVIKTYFFGVEMKTDWKVGSPVKMTGEMKGKKFEDKGEIRSFEPDRKLAFSHYSAMSGAPDAPENYHLVTYELQPEGDRTKVTLTQSNLTGGIKDSDIKNRADYEKNWSMVLDGLDKAVRH